MSHSSRTACWESCFRVSTASRWPAMRLRFSESAFELFGSTFVATLGVSMHGFGKTTPQQSEGGKTHFVLDLQWGPRIAIRCSIWFDTRRPLFETVLLGCHQPTFLHYIYTIEQLQRSAGIESMMKYCLGWHRKKTGSTCESIFVNTHIRQGRHITKKPVC